MGESVDHRYVGKVGGNKEFESNYIKDQQAIIDTIRDRLKIAQSR
jgi:hypothetical protein